MIPLEVGMCSSVRQNYALLLSGGLDSAILAYHLLHQGCRVQPIYIRTDLYWQEPELASARRFLTAIGSPRLSELITLDLPLRDLYGDHWSVRGEDVPDQDSPDEAVFLPGRNALLLIKAAVWCRLHRWDHLAIAPLGTSPFADAQQGFFHDFQAAMNCGEGPTVQLVRPFAEMTKRQVMELGRAAPLHLTFSCIAPIHGRHCGACNKCEERRQAFAGIHLADPTEYANRRRVKNAV